jgi:hypothetical protein
MQSLIGRETALGYGLGGFAADCKTRNDGVLHKCTSQGQSKVSFREKNGGTGVALAGSEEGVRRYIEEKERRAQGEPFEAQGKLKLRPPEEKKFP